MADSESDFVIGLIYSYGEHDDPRAISLAHIHGPTRKACMKEGPRCSLISISTGEDEPNTEVAIHEFPSPLLQSVRPGNNESKNRFCKQELLSNVGPCGHDTPWTIPRGPRPPPSNPVERRQPSYLPPLPSQPTPLPPLRRYAQLSACCPPRGPWPSTTAADDIDGNCNEPQRSSASELAAATTQAKYVSSTESRHIVVVGAGAGTHSAVGAAHRVGKVPRRPAGPGARDRGRAAKAGNRECVVLVLWPAIPTVVWTCNNGLGAALGQRRRAHRRAAHAPRSGPCGRLTRSPGDGRAGGTSAPRRLSGALGKASLRGEIYGISAERSGGGMWCRRGGGRR